MSVVHSSRTASVDEIAAEMDRRGAVIESLETALSAKDRDLAALDDELAGERWHADEAARQRDVWKDRATTAERARDEALSALREKEERVKALESAIRWALGEGDSDFGDNKPEDAKPFWWRRELRARSVLTPVSREQRGEEA